MKKTAKECIEECQSIKDGIELLEKEIVNLHNEIIWLKGKEKGICWALPDIESKDAEHQDKTKDN